MPRSSHTVARDKRSRRRRSWLISTMPARSPAVRAPATRWRRSRWLVGSSSSRMSGSGANARASAARRASPPESAAGSSSPVSPSCLQQIARAVADRRPRRRAPPRHRRASWQTRKNPAPAADGGSRRRAGRSVRPIRGHQPGGNAQQGRFAGAVAADEADAVAERYRQPCSGKKRGGPESQVDVLQRGAAVGHAPLSGACRRTDFHLPGHSRLAVRDRSAMTGAAGSVLPGFPLSVSRRRYRKPR